jgi:hypothetical protein
MAGEELKVDPSDLNNKATTIESIPWGEDPAAVSLSDPDKLAATTTSVQNLRKNATALGAEQKWGMAESERLAETLRLVAKAYEAVDEASRNNIDATFPGGSGAPTPAPVPIGANSMPAPPAPDAMPPFENVQAGREILDPIETDNKLMEGDQAASLRAAATEWTANAARLSDASEPFEIRMQNWEGVAAEAAYTKFKAFGGWLQALAGKWTQLAAEAEKLATAHDQAKSTNSPVRVEYEALQTQILTEGGLASPGTPALQARMTELYQESEEIRMAYASTGQPTAVQPPQPRPNSVAPSSPVTGNGDPNARGVPARTEDEERRGEGAGAGQPQSPGGGGAAGGGQPGGEPQMPPEAPVSPMSAVEPAQQTAQQAAQQGGSPGGGSPSGGAPSGGAPGGGMPGGGMPGSGKGDPQIPKLPTDPSLKPAAAGGGGGGSGGGGGGVPASPLQPAVSAETVAPTPVAGPGIPVAAGGGASGAGGGMGGMGGGMAPMMHGAQKGGDGDKKRNPQLSEDVPLYVEDRPHTEQVIGVRPRRRGAPDDGKKGDTQ